MKVAFYCSKEVLKESGVLEAFMYDQADNAVRKASGKCQNTAIGNIGSNRNAECSGRPHRTLSQADIVIEAIVRFD